MAFYVNGANRFKNWPKYVVSELKPFQGNEQDGKLEELNTEREVGDPHPRAISLLCYRLFVKF